MKKGIWALSCLAIWSQLNSVSKFMPKPVRALGMIHRTIIIIQNSFRPVTIVQGISQTAFGIMYLCKLGRHILWLGQRRCRGYNTDSPEWFQEWTICHIKIDLHNYVGYGHLKKGDIVWIYWKFSECIKEYHSIQPVFYTQSSQQYQRSLSKDPEESLFIGYYRRHFFSQRVVNRWNSLTLHVIDSASINVFNNGLNKMRRDSMGFFMDWSILVRLATASHILRIVRTGAAAPAKLPDKH